MPSLPFAVGGMATVSWQNNVITLGGHKEGRLLRIMKIVIPSRVSVLIATVGKNFLP